MTSTIILRASLLDTRWNDCPELGTGQFCNHIDTTVFSANITNISLRKDCFLKKLP